MFDAEAPMRLMRAIAKLKPLQQKASVTYLQRSLGRQILAMLRGGATSFHLRTFCNKFRIRVDDLLQEPSTEYFLTFVDEVRRAVAYRTDIPATERAELVSRITVAGHRMLLRYWQGEY
jgi:hypothetical protein